MKIFDKNGISADVVYARGGVVATQALIGGDVSFIADNGGAAIEATLACQRAYIRPFWRKA